MKLRRTLTAGIACAFIATGCARRPAELSIDQQAALVRAGDSDQIVIETTKLTDADLQVLGDLAGLRTLTLDHPENQITDRGLSSLATPSLGSLSGLMHLRIRGGDIGDAGVESLTALKRLRILNLPRTHVTDRGLAALKDLEHLEQLRIGSPRITDEGVAQLREFPSLRQVHLIDVPLSDAGVRVFANMPKLESLYLDGARVTDEAYDALFQARPALHVHIDQDHHDRDPHAHRHEN